MSLYIVSTMDWANIYNVDQYGCNRHDGNDVYSACNVTSKVCGDLKDLVNDWVAAAPNGTTRSYSDYGQTDWSTTPSADVQQLQLRKFCYHPLDMDGGHEPSSVELLVPAVFYVAFILLVALILMTLFMGSVSMSMVTVMASLVKAEKRKAKQYNLQTMRENYHMLASGTRKCPNELNFEFSVKARVAFACEDIMRKIFLERTYQAGYVLNHAAAMARVDATCSTPKNGSGNGNGNGGSKRRKRGMLGMKKHVGEHEQQRQYGKINWFEMSCKIMTQTTESEYVSLPKRARAACHAFCYFLVQNTYFVYTCQLAILVGSIACFLEAMNSQSVEQSPHVPGEYFIVFQESRYEVSE
jgi:hypothetical protein